MLGLGCSGGGGERHLVRDRALDRPTPDDKDIVRAFTHFPHIPHLYGDIRDRRDL